jgi:DUF2993 family protein
VSDGPTPLPSPSLPSPRQVRRISGKIWALVITPLVLIGLFVGLDRASAAYAANLIATKIQGSGFPVKPAVSVEGFPFPTQIISRHLDGVDISAPDIPAGPVTARIAVAPTRARDANDQRDRRGCGDRRDGEQRQLWPVTRPMASARSSSR